LPVEFTLLNPASHAEFSHGLFAISIKLTVLWTHDKANLPKKPFLVSAYIKLHLTSAGSTRKWHSGWIQVFFPA